MIYIAPFIAHLKKGVSQTSNSIATKKVNNEGFSSGAEELRCIQITTGEKIRGASIKRMAGRGAKNTISTLTIFEHDSLFLMPGV